MINHNQTLLSTETEQDIINHIKKGYQSCRTFFLTYTNEGYEIYTDKKREFLRGLCADFLKDFGNKELLFPIPISKINNFTKKNLFVPLTVRNGGFEYPRSFTVFMDRIKDINVIPSSLPDIEVLDEFFNSNNISKTLEIFFTQFFQRIKKIIIPLRRREAELLKLMTNIDFLKLDKNNSIRIFPPTLEDKLTALKYSSAQEKKLERAHNLLLDFKILSASGIIMDLSKVGFIYVLRSYANKNFMKSQDTDLQPFLVWNIGFPDHIEKIYCIPFYNIEDMNLINNSNTQTLTDWYWNVNFNEYEKGKNDPWQNFSIPDFISQEHYPSRFRHYILSNPLLREFKVWEKDVIKELTRMNNLSLTNIGELSNNATKEQISQFLKVIGEAEVFQHYPNVNFINIDFKIAFKFSIDNRDVFKNIINGLLTFPIVHIFSNEEKHRPEALGYLHCPRNRVSHLLENFLGIKEKFSDFEIKFSFSEFNRLSRCLNISHINIKFQSGHASIK
ncbi:MAG: hypothetical protein HeimC3_21510 [Candidatus Heimdallarchaeota archaeon LC_3]|nr:MAG: hypothetical protein HeimC3_21510 [Candidatus Heimdallarchaeota archaeon LC_3]